MRRRVFGCAWFPTAGWSPGVQFQVQLRLFPERERAGALGAIPGHSGISRIPSIPHIVPFEG